MVDNLGRMNIAEWLVRPKIVSYLDRRGFNRVNGECPRQQMDNRYLVCGAIVLLGLRTFNLLY